MKRLYYNNELSLEAKLYAAHNVDCELGTDKMTETMLLHTLAKGGFIDAEGIPEFQFDTLVQAFIEAHDLAVSIMEKIHEKDSPSE